MGSKTESHNENIPDLQMTKSGDSSRKHLIKKQIFSEIKNVIHNQGTNSISNQEFFDKGSCSITWKKQTKNESKPVIRKRNHKHINLSSSTLDEINLDFFDFRGKCCLKPHQSDQQIWSELKLYDDLFLNKIIENVQLRFDEKPVCKFTNTNYNDSEPEQIRELKNEFNYNYWPDSKDFKNEFYINFYLEKPTLFDDLKF